MVVSLGQQKSGYQIKILPIYASTVQYEYMKIEAEDYKGIEFIRISALPGDQKSKISQTIGSQHIIKILREKELLSDCIQYTDYSAWYSTTFAAPERTTQNPAQKREIRSPRMKLKKVFG